MNEERFDRNIRFFGKQGQARLRSASVAIVGVGGLGLHVAQQLAHLGVGALTLIDDEVCSFRPAQFTGSDRHVLKCIWI